MTNLKLYKETVPCCGIYCGGCPVYSNKNKGCFGQPDRCQKKQCKSIYKCCIEKKGLRFCFECDIFPCSGFRKFTDTWKKYGQDLIRNQELLKQNGEKWFIKHYNDKIT